MYKITYQVSVNEAVDVPELGPETDGDGQCRN